MEVLQTGHNYRLAAGNQLVFLKKEQNPATGVFELVQDGTTNEEVLDVLIDRVRTLNAKLPCRENSLAITKLEEALHWLNARTATRLAKGVESTPLPH